MLGPAPAPIERIKERFRHHLLAKAASGAAFATAMDAVRDVESLSKGTLRVTLDVDPGAML